MKKHLALIAVVVLASFATSGIALAKADVQKLVPLDAWDCLQPDASGKAVVNYPDGDNANVELIITVSAKGLDPGGYEVKGCTDSLTLDYTHIGYFDTNKNGNGHFHKIYRPGDTLPPTNHIYIKDKLSPSHNVILDEDFE